MDYFEDPHLCLICFGYHPLKYCKYFKTFTQPQREYLVRVHRYCTQCFSRSHLLDECTLMGACERCHGCHHTMLHPEVNEKDISYGQHQQTTFPNSMPKAKYVGLEQRRSCGNIYSETATTSKFPTHHSCWDPRKPKHSHKPLPRESDGQQSTATSSEPPYKFSFSEPRYTQREKGQTIYFETPISFRDPPREEQFNPWNPDMTRPPFREGGSPSDQGYRSSATYRWLNDLPQWETPTRTPLNEPCCNDHRCPFRTTFQAGSTMRQGPFNTSVRNRRTLFSAFRRTNLESQDPRSNWEQSIAFGGNQPLMTDSERININRLFSFTRRRSQSSSTSSDFRSEIEDEKLVTIFSTNSSDQSPLEQQTSESEISDKANKEGFPGQTKAALSEVPPPRKRPSEAFDYHNPVPLTAKPASKMPPAKTFSEDSKKVSNKSRPTRVLSLESQDNLNLQSAFSEDSKKVSAKSRPTRVLSLESQENLNLQSAKSLKDTLPEQKTSQVRILAPTSGRHSSDISWHTFDRRSVHAISPLTVDVSVPLRKTSRSLRRDHPSTPVITHLRSTSQQGIDSLPEEISDHSNTPSTSCRRSPSQPLFSPITSRGSSSQHGTDPKILLPITRKRSLFRKGSLHSVSPPTIRRKRSSSPPLLPPTTRRGSESQHNTDPPKCSPRPHGGSSSQHSIDLPVLPPVSRKRSRSVLSISPPTKSRRRSAFQHGTDPPTSLPKAHGGLTSQHSIDLPVLPPVTCKRSRSVHSISPPTKRRRRSASQHATDPPTSLPETQWGTSSQDPPILPRKTRKNKKPQQTYPPIARGGCTSSQHSTDPLVLPSTTLGSSSVQPGIHPLDLPTIAQERSDQPTSPPTTSRGRSSSQHSTDPLLVPPITQGRSSFQPGIHPPDLPSIVQERSDRPTSPQTTRRGRSAYQHSTDPLLLPSTTRGRSSFQPGIDSPDLPSIAQGKRDHPTSPSSTRRILLTSQHSPDPLLVPTTTCARSSFHHGIDLPIAKERSDRPISRGRSSFQPGIDSPDLPSIAQGKRDHPTSPSSTRRILLTSQHSQDPLLVPTTTRARSSFHHGIDLPIAKERSDRPISPSTNRGAEPLLLPPITREPPPFQHHTDPLLLSPTTTSRYSASQRANYTLKSPPKTHGCTSVQHSQDPLQLPPITRKRSSSPHGIDPLIFSPTSRYETETLIFPPNNRRQSLPQHGRDPLSLPSIPSGRSSSQHSIDPPPLPTKSHRLLSSPHDLPESPPSTRRRSCLHSSDPQISKPKTRSGPLSPLGPNIPISPTNTGGPLSFQHIDDLKSVDKISPLTLESPRTSLKSRRIQKRDLPVTTPTSRRRSRYPKVSNPPISPTRSATSKASSGQHKIDLPILSTIRRRQVLCQERSDRPTSRRRTSTQKKIDLPKSPPNTRRGSLFRERSEDAKPPPTTRLQRTASQPRIDSPTVSSAKPKKTSLQPSKSLGPHDVELHEIQLCLHDILKHLKSPKEYWHTPANRRRQQLMQRELFELKCLLRQSLKDIASPQARCRMSTCTCPQQRSLKMLFQNLLQPMQQCRTLSSGRQLQTCIQHLLCHVQDQQNRILFLAESGFLEKLQNLERQCHTSERGHRLELVQQRLRLQILLRQLLKASLEQLRQVLNALKK